MEPRLRKHREELNGDLGVVYLIKSGRLYKIGSTRKILENRLAALRSTLPVSMEACCSFRAKYHSLAEKLLQKKFADKRVQGEWFRLLPKDVDFINSIEALDDRDWRAESLKIFGVECELPQSVVADEDDEDSRPRVKPKPKEKIIYARADKDLCDRLQRVSEAEDRPSSQIVREAVKAELDRIEGKSK